MFCEKCGNEIADNIAFCPKCGAAVAKPVPTNDVTQLSPEQPPKKAFKAIGIVAVAVIVVAAIVAVVFMFINSKGYEKEVEKYLDFFAEQKDDAESYVMDAYSGGNFDEGFLGGKSADKINEMLFAAMFDVQEEMLQMGSYDVDIPDDWQEYLEESNIEYLYDEIEEEYGDWELTYEIKDSKKLSDSKTEKLNDVFEEYLEYYEEILDEDALDLDSDEEEKLEKFIDKMSKKKIKTAYEVEAKVTVDTDEGKFKNTFEFKVAKIGGSWFILEGPSVEEMFED